jgi:cell division protein FtsL
MNKQMVMVVMVLAALASAVAVVEVKHESRKRFVALQGLEKARDQMNVEWGQLQLEQGTWATHSRVERIARKKLHMVIPKMEHVVIVRQATAKK